MVILSALYYTHLRVNPEFYRHQQSIHVVLPELLLYWSNITFSFKIENYYALTFNIKINFIVNSTPTPALQIRN